MSHSHSHRMTLKVYIDLQQPEHVELCYGNAEVQRFTLEEFVDSEEFVVLTIQNADVPWWNKPFLRQLLLRYEEHHWEEIAEVTQWSLLEWMIEQTVRRGDTEWLECIETELDPSSELGQVYGYLIQEEEFYRHDAIRRCMVWMCQFVLSALSYERTAA